MVFTCEDTGEKLLIPDELAKALRQEVLARQQAEEQVTAGTPSGSTGTIAGRTVEDKVAIALRDRSVLTLILLSKAD